MNKMIACLLLMVASNVFGAENCTISVSKDASASVQNALVNKGYKLTSRAQSSYVLVFEDFSSKAIFEDGGYRPLSKDDRIISVAGPVVMKIYKLMPNNKMSLQFALKNSGSVSTCYGTCVKDLDEGTAKLYLKLTDSKRFSSNLPHCRALN